MKTIAVETTRENIICDVNGNVLKYTSPEHSVYEQFNFDECDAFWDRKRRNKVYNVLDLGGVKSDGTCFSPCYAIRNQMLTICPKWLSIRIRFGSR